MLHGSSGHSFPRLKLSGCQALFGAVSNQTALVDPKKNATTDAATVLHKNLMQVF